MRKGEARSERRVGAQEPDPNGPGAIFTRRRFLAVAGSGLFVLFSFDPLQAQETSRPRGASRYPTDFNAYLHFGEDGRVTCFVGKVELGQGSRTALAQIAAEELNVPYDSVDMVMGDTELCPWDMGTFGSLTVRMFGPVLRGAAAEARAVLLELASERLGIPVERLRTRAGIVSAPDAGKEIGYADLVQGRRIERHIENVPVKDVGRYEVVGKAVPRKDALEKVTGKARYAADLGPPGTLHARLVRPPAHGAELRDVDTSATEKIDGVRVLRDGDLIAVLHERPDVADRALALVRARFDRPQAAVDDTTIFDHLLKESPPPETVDESGDIREGEKLAAQVFDRRYLNSYVSHAPLETHSAVARIEGGKVTVWVSTQAPFVVQAQVARGAGFAPEDVRVITPYVGAGFGGKTGAQQAVEAVRLAHLAGAPVQVVWNRSEEFFFDSFRPAAVVKIRSGLSKAGRICFWDYAVYAAGDREAKQFYDVPHQRTVSSGDWGGEQPPGLHPFAVGPWRAPSVNTNTFARESQIDVMAVASGRDPLEFRLDHLGDPRMAGVLRAAAEKFGYGASRGRRASGSAAGGRNADSGPQAARNHGGGTGIGIACATYMGTYVATLAQVEVERSSGAVQVRRVVCAQDMGLVVNPEGARQQTEGAVTMGLGYALAEEVRFRGGEVLDRNFDTYRIPRFSWLPEIETILIDNPQTPASGCGEPPIVCMGAVLANAISDAVGARVLQLPMTPERIRATLKG